MKKLKRIEKSMVSLRVANQGSGNNNTGGTSSGTIKIHESGFSGISTAVTGAIQTQITATLATGVRPAWMTISARASNWIPPEMANIYNQFLSLYYTGNYRI